MPSSSYLEVQKASCCYLEVLVPYSCNLEVQEASCEYLEVLEANSECLIRM